MEDQNYSVNHTELNFPVNDEKVFVTITFYNIVQLS